MGKSRTGSSVKASKGNGDGKGKPTARCRGCSRPAGKPLTCQTIHDAISDLAQSLRTPAPQAADAGHAKRVLKRVRAVREDFQQHVASVQAGNGFFNDVLEKCPRLSFEVEKLSAQHAQLDDRLGRLQDDLRSCSAKGRDYRRICQSATDLADAMEEHQRVSNDLLWEAYCSDLGVAE